MNSQLENRPSLMIIDSYALLFRGFYAPAATGNYMRNEQGMCTNGLYQFTRYMQDAIRTFRPTHVARAFDMGAKTFRNELYPAYKAHREEPPEELILQFDWLWDLVEAFGIPCLGKEGYEADDVIGSFAAQCSAQGIHVNILTGDGDALQLINEHTHVTLMKKGIGNYLTIGLHNLEQERQVKRPDQIIDMKALMGYASDNIPGCPQVGPKTALKLIREFDHVDGLFSRIDEVPGKLRERLLGHKDIIYLSRELVTIRTHLDIDCPLEKCVYKPDLARLAERLEQLECSNIMRAVAV